MGLLSPATRDALARRAVPIVHELLLFRLRCEAAVVRLLFPNARRVATTACWTFPIYSQTFVHQEVAALARAGFSVRFLYSTLGPRTELADSCRDLWSLKRRVLLDRETATADFARFRARMPAKVDAALDRLSSASGLTRAELEQHEHVLHAFSFTRAVEAWGADYLHSYFFYERTLFSFIASQLLDVPRGVSCYADHVLQDYALKVVALHLRTCDVVVATSRRIRSELETIRGAKVDAVIVKPNAIDTSKFVPRDRPYPGSGPLRLLCVSRLDPKKGLEYLIAAIALLRDRGVSVQAHIVGAADSHSQESLDYAERLQRSVEETGLQQSVIFAGRRDSSEVQRFLDDAHIFVAPFVELANGDKDGIPTAVLEAMAAGASIVATTAGSIAEIVDDGVDGLLVVQRDAAALADAIERLARDTDLAARLGRAAAARARRDFDVTTSEHAFHKRIHGVIGGRRDVLIGASASR